MQNAVLLERDKPCLGVPTKYKSSRERVSEDWTTQSSRLIRSLIQSLHGKQLRTHWAGFPTAV